jgi:hypothetical protein
LLHESRCSHRSGVDRKSIAQNGWRRSDGGLWSRRGCADTAERGDFNVSFFVIIVVVPYLIALVAFLKPKWLERFRQEWPWETRRLERGSSD